jgi:hypothetical protein
MTLSAFTAHASDAKSLSAATPMACSGRNRLRTTLTAPTGDGYAQTPPCGS